MTPEEFTQRLPPLSHNPLPAKPPFVFNGLSSRVLPLRANLDSLQRFVNGYLNFVPESVGRFRASVPYVFLSVLDYGSVSESAGLGWFAQTEVFFAVALDWYRKVDGRWVFHDWATITPFIYVDDNFSVPLGRTVSGFPKVLSRVTQVSSEWVRNPLAALTLARIETEVFPAAYAGKRLENRVFLEVLRDAPMNNARLPLDPRSPIAPWTLAANLADAAGGLGRDALWLAQALRIFPQVPAGQMAGMLPGMLARLAPTLRPGGTGLVMNSLNLKQFRRADKPDELCYQALTNGPMITSAFNQGGLLGEERTLLGDLSGGHSVRLHEYASLPIVRTLGLEVQRRWQGDGVSVAELKPVLPLWMDVNVSLEPSINLAWRSHDGVWKDGSGAPMPPDARPGAAPAAATSTQAPTQTPAPIPRYNTALASAVDAISGPFEYTGATVRVLPLLALRAKLQAHLDKTINGALADPVLHPDGRSERVRLQLWSRPAARGGNNQPVGGEHAYVYMTVASFAGVTSGSNNVGDWADDELAFLVPVCWQRQDAAGTWVTEGVGVVPAYFFVDDSIAAVSRCEVQGIDARTANFVRPASAWLSDGGGTGPQRQTLLRVDTEVWAALDAGQQAMVRPVVEIVQHEANAGLGSLGSQDGAYQWSETLRAELIAKKATRREHPEPSKTARALALELLGNRAPLAMYTLKQFRDVVDPDKACYQALVRVPRVLKEVFDICEIEETLAVRISDFPELDIVGSLGLVAMQLDDKSAGVLYSAQAIRPFSIRATVAEPLAELLMSRAGSRLWQLSDQAFQGRLGSADGGPAITVNPSAETLQDRSDPCRMAALMIHTGRHGAPGKRGVYGPAAARTALGLVDPQMVIEALLSREWGHAGSGARWRQGRQAVIASQAALPQGGAGKPAAEAALYRALLARQAQRPGFPKALLDFAEQVISNQQAFTQARALMEGHFDALAPWLMSSAADAQPAGNDTAAGPGQATVALLGALRGISALRILGEPSNTSQLDLQVQGYTIKLHRQLLDRPPLSDLATLDGLAGPSNSAQLVRVKAAADPIVEAVAMARKLCEAQNEALLNTLGRAWQKPDFCIYRDAVGADRDRLLATTGCWDADWYCG